MTTETSPLTARQLEKRTLVLAALDGTTPLGGQRLEPGSDVSVGSNSGNDLVIPERFELTTYKLISRGSVLHVVPPFHVQASVWIDGEVRELNGYVRDLRKKHPDFPMELPLASERFIVRYASGIALIGRFVEDAVE